MSLLSLSLAFAWHHRVATLCTSISVALAIAVLLLVLHVRDDVKQGVIPKGEGAELIVGNARSETLVKEGIFAYGSVLILLAAGMILATLFLTTLVRRRDHAILRSLGARPLEIFLVVIGEAFLQITLGVIVGVLVSRLALVCLEANLVTNDGIAATVFHFHFMELAAILLAYGVGLIAALLPAWQAYRLDVASSLKR